MYEQTHRTLTSNQKKKEENITCAKCCSTYSSVYTDTYRLLLDW